MIASAHVADVSPATALRLLARPPRPRSTAGLRFAALALTAPLGPDVRPRPTLERVGLLAFWDDEADLDRFLANDPTAATLAGGFRVRLEPLRASGSWPGLDADTPTSRSVAHDGPVAAMTLGRLRITQGLRFLRASARAEAAVLAAPGLLWATGLGRPPLVSTFSLWESTAALSTFAYGRGEPAHPDAIAQGEAKPFHKQQAFVRFHPFDATGHLTGANPMGADVAAKIDSPRDLRKASPSPHHLG